MEADDAEEEGLAMSSQGQRREVRLRSIPSSIATIAICDTNNLLLSFDGRNIGGSACGRVYDMNMGGISCYERRFSMVSFQYPAISLDAFQS